MCVVPEKKDLKCHPIRKDYYYVEFINGLKSHHSINILINLVSCGHVISDKKIEMEIDYR